MTTDSSTPTVARTITASEFKARCLKLMDEVTETGDEVVITKRGKPVAKLSPYRKKPKSLFGIDRGRYEITGDIDEPIDVDWYAETHPDSLGAPSMLPCTTSYSLARRLPTFRPKYVTLTLRYPGA